MFVFGNRSLDSLSTADGRWTEICNMALSLGVMDFSVLEGHRNKQKQNAAYDEDNSQVRWPNGKHNTLPSLAVDLAPYPIIWSEGERFRILAGLIFACAAILGYKLRWGGDWNSNGRMRDEKFRDPGHFELVDA